MDFGLSTVCGWAGEWERDAELLAVVFLCIGVRPAGLGRTGGLLVAGGVGLLGRWNRENDYNDTMNTYTVYSAHTHTHTSNRHRHQRVLQVQHKYPAPQNCC